MDHEWPDIVIDGEEEDSILDEEILLSGAELGAAEREAFAALNAAMQAAAKALGSIVGALQGFCDALRTVHDDTVLSETELS